MSIIISSTSISYYNSINGYYGAKIVVSTSNEDLDYLEIVNSNGLIDLAQYIEPQNAIYELSYGTLTYGQYDLIIKAHGLNSSISDNYSITLDFKDRWAPVLNDYSLPVSYNSLTVPVSYSVTQVTNDSGGYEIGFSETNNILDAAWGNETSFTFSSEGIHTLYAWVRDTSNNISDVQLTTVYIDTIAPIVSFSVPDSSISSTIPITSLIVNDVSSVKFAVTTTNIEPEVWLDNQPTEINVDSSGSYVFYCWVKDQTGNITFSSDTCEVDLYKSAVSVSIQTEFASPTVSFNIDTIDIYGIAGYYVSHINSYNEANLVGVKPYSYTFLGLNQGSEYNFELYFWVKNNLNNISDPIIKPISIYIPDTTKPSIVSFSLPMAINELTVTISSFIANDNKLVSDYYISESSVTPTADFDGWVQLVPTGYTFSDSGQKRLYAWVKDSSGNISEPSWADISVADSIKPIIKSFTLPTVYNLLTVPIETFTITDNTAIAGYYISEEQGAPNTDSYLWLGIKPTEYQFYTFGSKVLYAYAKDTNNNISDVAIALCVVEESTINKAPVKALSGNELLSQHNDLKPITLSSIFRYIKARLAIDQAYSNSKKFQVFTNVQSFRLVVLTAAGITHSNIATSDGIIGFTLESGEPSFNISVQYKDEVVNPLWDLELGLPIYAIDNGLFVQEYSEGLRCIGIAISTSSILIRN